MRRQVSIGIFYGIIVLAIIAGILFMNMTIRQERTGEELVAEEQEVLPEQTLAHPQPQTQMPSTEASVPTGGQAEPQYKYLLKVKNGEISVYDGESSRLYLDTGIRMRELPEYMQLRIDEGMGFYTEEELFAFLESYSS